MKNRNDLLFVSVQGILFVAYLFDIGDLTDLPDWVQFAGIVIGLSGLIVCLLSFWALNRNLSPFPSPVENGQLITSGVYRMIRHPIYTGVILLAIGYGLFSASFSRLIISGILFLFFYIKSTYEEKLLLQKYPAYAVYKLKTGRLFPRFVALKY